MFNLLNVDIEVFVSGKGLKGRVSEETPTYIRIVSQERQTVNIIFKDKIANIQYELGVEHP